jgi:hypothetical protein
LLGTGFADAGEATGTRDEAETATIQEELETLYSEIEPVALMSVNQEYLEPILWAIKNSEAQRSQLSGKCLDYVRAMSSG